MQVAFDNHGFEFNNPKEMQDRLSFVASDEEKFIGCSSGLAQKSSNSYGRYFFLSDLLVEKK